MKYTKSEFLDYVNRLPSSASFCRIKTIQYGDDKVADASQYNVWAILDGLDEEDESLDIKKSPSIGHDLSDATIAVIEAALVDVYNLGLSRGVGSFADGVVAGWIKRIKKVAAS